MRSRFPRGQWSGDGTEMYHVRSLSMNRTETRFSETLSPYHVAARAAAMAHYGAPSHELSCFWTPCRIKGLRNQCVKLSVLSRTRFIDERTYKASGLSLNRASGGAIGRIFNGL